MSEISWSPSALLGREVSEDEFLQLVRDIPRASVDTIEQIAGAAASSEMPAGTDTDRAFEGQLVVAHVLALKRIKNQTLYEPSAKLLTGQLQASKTHAFEGPAASLQNVCSTTLKQQASEGRIVRSRVGPAWASYKYDVLSARELLANEGEQALLQETTQLHEMQLTLETGYQELNKQRRSMDSLRQGVERQQKSLEAIQAENSRLKGEVLELRQKCQVQVAQNATLSQGIAQRRQARADGNTQAALLQAVLKQEGTNDELARMETELKICRAQSGKPFDEPLDPQKVPVLEMIWEHLYPQMKRIGSIFHALEARDNSWAMDMRRSLTEERTQAPTNGNQQTSGNRRLSRAAYRTAAAKCSPVSAYLHVKVSEELRQRVAQEEEERTIELAKSDILGELEELKRRRRDLSLELELRDYVTLASMKEKEADWWGQAARNAAAYGQLDAQKMATWKPAPKDCAPLRLRIFGYAGRPWHVLKAVAFRGATFDAIDAPNLHEGVGLLGLSTWFDMLLKQVPHSYIQTRHCEDFFVDRLEQHMSSEWAPMSIRAAVQSRGGYDVKKFSKTMPGAFNRNAKELAGIWTRDATQAEGLKVLGKVGSAPHEPCERVAACIAQWNRLPLAKLADSIKQFEWCNKLGHITPSTFCSLEAARGADAQRPGETSRSRSASPVEHLQFTALSRLSQGESKFFEHLSRQSLTTKVSAVQLQLLLGMAFRCEPITGDLGLIYLGAANLRPARRDFLPWDSILATSFADWPGDVSQFSEEALGGTKSAFWNQEKNHGSGAQGSISLVLW
ncbi:unnamed protein product [Cladocopium goreaui]|uniref:Uncharacterized protein n=1 Tax=Cladocopium goreaui TaxID=2562237 RepID=A0A9P1DFP8_9DINO|nr:unnamed protein product [Cladocopium goreaui]